MGEEKATHLLERQLEKYPAALDPSQVAEALNVSRKTVDRLLDDGKLPFFAVDPAAERKQKRVTKADLIVFMQNQQL